MGISDFFNAPKIKKENEQLKALFEKINASDAIGVQQRIDELLKERDVLQTANNNLIKTKNDLSATIDQKRSEIIELDDEILYQSFALYKPQYDFLTSEEYKFNLDGVREEQKKMIKAGNAAGGSGNWTVNNSKKQGEKMVKDVVKLLLRSFNNECDYCVDHVTFNNISAMQERMHKSYDALNKLGKIWGISINPKYADWKMEELKLAFEYRRKKQEEKEEQKRLREEMREQQKLEQEIKAAREKIAKERKHFSAALKELSTRLANAASDKEKALIQEKINQIDGKMSELEKEEKVIDYREQNAKAGYVYIISNIGSFGENVYKIGMTRRLEPQDRVDELGDASVPFSFDVHAMIFSENAPDLEAKLHQHFYNNRINKLNNRKEFFKADINEIEQVVKANYDKIVDMVKESPAEQFRESTKMSLDN